MFHLALYDASIANGAVLLQIAALSDPVIAPAGSLGLLTNPAVPNIMRVSAVGTNLTRVQLISGTIRDLAPFDVGPVNVGTVIESPARGLFFDSMPFPLAVNEELDAWGVQSNAAAQRMTVAVTFCDGPVRPVTGRIWSLHWTASTTLVANAFTAVTPTFDNGLPAGTFAVVGSRCISAGALYHRHIPRAFPGMAFLTRPGTYAYQAQDNYEAHNDRQGGMGEWYRFTNTALPQIEIFSRSADTSEEGYFDLIKVG